MRRLRSAAFLARCVLAWFVVALGVAVAAPLVQPRALQLVCGAGAVKLLPQDGEDAAPAALTLDCALCAPALGPPPPAFALVLPAAGSPQQRVLVAAPPADAADLHPPPRGPPADLLA